MKKHSRRTSRLVMALTALCLVWLLSGHVPSAPAFAEGSGQPLPIESLPVDTTFIPGNAVVPDGGTATADMIGVVILFFTAVL